MTNSTQTNCGLLHRTSYLLATVLAACGAESASEIREQDAPAEPWFEEVAASAGFEFRHSVALERHYYMPENVTGGVGLLDYDGDGDLDVYLTQGGDLDMPGDLRFSNVLYRNEGEGRFRDVTQEARVGDTGYGIGCTVGDYDSDGDPDLYVTNFGPNVLYRNEGDGTFTDVSALAGVGDPGFASSCAFGDMDLDGDLDLIVVNYIEWSVAGEIECALGGGVRDYCGPLTYAAPAPDLLFENQGDGSFREVSERAGLRKFFGNGLGVVLGDFDSNGAPDIYITNDANPNQLWVNDGQGNFIERAAAWGCAVNMNGAAEAGMGVDAADFDHDGDLDLFMTHLSAETNTLYENRGKFFRDVTPMTGLAKASRDYTGFGVGFCDFDHDGYLDAYVANGRVKRDSPIYSEAEPYAEPNQVFRGASTGRFEELQPAGGTEELLLGVSRAAAFGDLDNDGDLDVVVSNSQGRPYVLLNRIGTRKNWIQLRVLNEVGGYALGATVSIETRQGTQLRVVRRAFSYCASNDPRVHFGLGTDSEARTVTVRWPDGAKTEHGPLAAGALHEIRR